jgi:hypothetical protein
MTAAHTGEVTTPVRDKTGREPSLTDETAEARTTFRGHMVNLHAASIAAMRDNLAALPWWAWKRRTNIREQLAGVAISMIRDKPYEVETRATSQNGPAGSDTCITCQQEIVADDTAEQDSAAGGRWHTRCAEQCPHCASPYRHHRFVMPTVGGTGPCGHGWHDTPEPPRLADPIDPQPGDVWHDVVPSLTGGMHWHARTDENGDVELYEPDGPGLVPARDVPTMRGGMTLVSRSAGSSTSESE